MNSSRERRPGDETSQLPLSLRIAVFEREGDFRALPGYVAFGNADVRLVEAGDLSGKNAVPQIDARIGQREGRKKPVRFNFELTNGSLYAFWVSRDGMGRSDGYVGDGDPGYDGVVDAVGRAAPEAVRSETITAGPPAPHRVQ